MDINYYEEFELDARLKKVGIESDKLNLIYELVGEIIAAKEKALEIIIGLYRYKGIEFDDEEKTEVGKELTNQIKDKVIEYVYSNDDVTYSEAMIVINYFLLQIYKGIGLKVEEVIMDPCKAQFILDNEIYEATGEESEKIKLYNKLISPINEAINTLVNFIRSIYRSNRLIFKEEEKKTVHDNLIYELSDIIVHHIYNDEEATYNSAIDRINEYMVEFIGRFIKVRDNKD
ncbi:MAG: hypothetical protein ACRDD7_14270 [Peptostreptococcaceae bacterium]